MSMAGHGMGGGQFGGVMRSMRRDDSVTSQRVTKGTARRMIQFARPYRTILIWFLVLVVIDAVIGVVNPLLFRSIIDTGIPRHDKSLIIGLSVLAAVLALFDTGLSIGSGGSRPRSARGSSSTCGRRSSSTSRRCPSPSSPAPRPAP